MIELKLTKLELDHEAFLSVGIGAPGQISVIEMFTAASLKPKQHRLSISFPESFIAFNFIPCASLVKIGL